MAASPFERQVVEGDATDDRSPASRSMADGPQQYPPSPSFLDHDRPTVRLVELPAWLQSFASSVGEPSEPEPPATPDSSPTEQPVSSSGNDSSARDAGNARTASQKSSNVSTDFISEDDLPEWLRAIAPEGPAESSFEMLAAERGEESEQITVPTISRAWSTSKDSRGVDETTSLFALVASQATQTALPDQDLGGGTSASARINTKHMGGEVAGYGTDRPPDEPASIELPMPEYDESSDASVGGDVESSFPTLLVVVAGILLVMLILVAAIVFL